jgi:hypothetical protein
MANPAKKCDLHHGSCDLSHKIFISNCGKLPVGNLAAGTPIALKALQIDGVVDRNQSTYRLFA